VGHLSTQGVYQSNGIAQRRAMMTRRAHGERASAPVSEAEISDRIADW
jgi:hypothetical protein